MAKLNIKKGDTVVVIAGKDKGKTGKVLQTVAVANRAVVEGINIVTIHRKPRSQKEPGGIVKQPAPVQISNLMVVCPVCGKATRVGRKVVDGKNARICKKCNASLDKAFVKAVKNCYGSVGKYAAISALGIAAYSILGAGIGKIVEICKNKKTQKTQAEG